MISRLTKCIGLLWLAGLTSSASAASLPEQVSAARAEVEALAERLENQRRSSATELSSLRAERAELRRQVRLEKIRRDTLEQLRADRSKRVDAQEGRIRSLLKPVQSSIASAKAYVSATLPFKQEERMRRLQGIESSLAVTHPDPATALTQLWRFVEEEEALAREIGLSRQAVTLDGKRFLASVARIGMALMYFRLPDGKVGWVHRSKKGWTFSKLETKEERATVNQLFDDFEKNRMLGGKRLLISSELPDAQKERLR